MCVPRRRAWLPYMSGRLVKVKGKLHSWSVVSNTWNGSWQTGEIFYTVCLCACVSEGVGVCQMVKLAVRIRSGRVLLGCRHSGCAHEMTGWQKKVCVCVGVCKGTKKWWKMGQGHFSILYLRDLFLTCIYDRERELLGIQEWRDLSNLFIYLFSLMTHIFWSFQNKNIGL